MKLWDSILQFFRGRSLKEEFLEIIENDSTPARKQEPKTGPDPKESKVKETKEPKVKEPKEPKKRGRKPKAQ